MVGEVDEILNKIIDCLNNYNNFCLDAGAGSGKTYTLIETIKYIRKEYPNRKIVCITFTNNAKAEIISRLTNTENMHISTIHDFIWKNISRFQSVLRTKVNELIDEKINKYKLEGNIEKLTKYENANLNLPISYRDYESLSKGIISHDTLLDIFLNFLENSYYRNILFSSIDYIFIDEYQDTNKKIFDRFCEGIIDYQNISKNIVLGLFGDFMQNIYEEGIGKINPDLEANFIFIKKVENYRSGKKIIEVNNCLREDLKQICMKSDIDNGPIKFIYNYSNDIYLNNNFSDYNRLHLTHRIISDEIGFQQIYLTYSKKYTNNTSSILKNADERFLRYMCNEIMPSIYDYKMGIHNNLIKNINLNYFNFELLNKIKDKIDEIINNIDKDTILNFLNKFFELNMFSDKLFSSICQSYADSDDIEFLNSISNISAIEFYNYYLQYSGKTMLETMHGTKGNEFDNILINIHENTTWNWYNFTKLFKNESLKDSIKARTYKLLYVACTRAKKSLIINYIIDNETSKNDDSGLLMIEKIKNIWGENIEYEIHR